MSEFKPCFLIPCYNHGNTLFALIDKLTADFNYPLFIVDDGSDIETRTIIDSLANKVEIVRLTTNQGKGGAVKAGLKSALQAGFSHAIQIDADGQHDLGALYKLLSESKAHPQSLISGKPVYDDSVPKVRLYSRYLTHILVWLETLSFEIKDSMCGFRSYPLKEVDAVIAKYKIGCRMDFDSEIMVKSFWSDIEIRDVDTKVIYPENGISHFNMLEDNALLIKMHICLIFGMLKRIPRLITRKKRLQQKLIHWSKQRESGSYYGIRFLLFIYSLFGRNIFRLCLKPVILYYLLFAKTATQSSKAYLETLKVYAQKNDIELPKKLTAYRHINSFAETILDKLAAWKGDFSIKNVTVHNKDVVKKAKETKRGCVILGSHLGNLEVLRALSKCHKDLKINALVFVENAARFNAVMDAINPDSSLNMIQVSKVGPETAIMLDQKIEAGEWIVIVGDRTSITLENKVIWTDFLGKKAPFPQGPFLLASILKAPVYLLFGLRDTRKKGEYFDLYLEHFSDQIKLPRGKREESLQSIVEQYAQRLQFYTLKNPLQWYNFFNFWTLTSKKNDNK